MNVYLDRESENFHPPVFFLLRDEKKKNQKCGLIGRVENGLEGDLSRSDWDGWSSCL